MSALLDRVPVWVAFSTVGALSTLLIAWSVLDYSQRTLGLMAIKPAVACALVQPNLGAATR